MIKITVGLITYNRQDLLKRALNSVLSQTYKNIEILIGNDFEKEKISYNSLGIKKNKKVKIYNHKKNLGERNNMNFLLKKCKTDWFIWLADDDYFHKDLIKRLVFSLKGYKNKKDIVASFTNYSRFDLKNIVTKKKQHIYSTETFLEGYISKKIRLIGVFGLIKTNILKKIGGIHKTGKSFTNFGKTTHHYPYCDILLPILLSSHGKIIWLEEKLVYLNTDHLSISSRSDEYVVYKSAEKYVYSKLIKILNQKKIQSKFEVQKNIIDLFMQTRLTVIQKKYFLENILLIVYYFFDFFIFYKDYKEILNIKKYLKYIYLLIKSILKAKKF